MTDIELKKRMANAIRALAMDAVEKAKSGHPGMPMGMADVATVLFTRFLKFDADYPRFRAGGSIRARRHRSGTAGAVSSELQRGSAPHRFVRTSALRVQRSSLCLLLVTTSLAANRAPE